MKDITYIYAPSMAILAEAGKRYLFENIIVISYNEAIIRFCKKTGTKIIELESNKDFSFLGLLRHKKHIKYLAQCIKNQEIVFGHNTHDWWGIYLMFLLRVSNNVYYYKLQIDYDTVPIKRLLFKNNGLRILKDNLIRFFFTGVFFNSFTINDKEIVGIKPQRLFKFFLKFEIPPNQNSLEENREIIFKKYKLQKPKIILIDQGEVFYKYPEELVKEIIRLSKNFDSFYLKQHPTFKTINSELLENLLVIPSEIPLELITDDSIVIIGIASNSMKSVNKGISFLNLILIDLEWKIIYEKILKGTKIIIIKDISDIEKQIKLFV